MANYMHAAFYALIFSLLALGASQAQIYQAGDIYPYFGTNGKVSVFEEEGTTLFNNPRHVIYLLDNQDRLYVSAVCTEYTGTDSSFYALIYRFLSNGQRDSTWATNGQLRYDLPGYFLTIRHTDLALQSDNQLLFLQTGFPRNHSFPIGRLVRFSTEGQLDANFGVQGEIYITADTSESKAPILYRVLASNGRILLGDIGAHLLTTPINGDNTVQTAIWAFHEQDGRRDSLWGDRYGIAYITISDLGFGTTHDPRLFALSDNRFLVTGLGRLFCFQPNGQKDSSFGLLGIGATGIKINPNGANFGGVSSANAERSTTRNSFAEQHDGKILMYGMVSQSGFLGQGLTIERMLPNGQLDSSFGQNGLVAGIGQGLGRRFSVGGIALDSAQRIVLSYSAENNDTTTNNPHVILRSWDIVERYLPSGQLDSSFGQNGRVFVNFHDNDSLSQAFQLFMRQDGLILFTSASVIHSQAIQGRPQVSLDFTCLLSEPWVDSTGITDSTGLSLASLAVQQRLRVFPNPVLGSDLQLSYHLPQASKISYLLYDMQGRLVQYQNRGLVAEGEQQEVLPLAPSLSPGQYILEMRVDGARTQVQIQKL